jgi:hypothetical protein
LILTCFIVSAFAAPIDDEVLEDGPLALPQIEEGPMVLPQVEEGVIEVQEEPVKESDDDEVIEDAEAAFMRMMNLGMSMGGYPNFMSGYNQLSSYNPMSSYNQMFSPFSYGQMDPYSMKSKMYNQ